MQSTQNLQVESGNRIIIKFGGSQVGLVQSIRLSDDYAPEPASGIGDMHVVEYVPGMARHTVAVSSMIIRKSSLRKLGIAPENGDAVLQGLVFELVVQSKDDGTVLRKISGCSYASGETEIQKHAILMSSGMFNALDVSGTSI